jgi:hypothetical protein
MCSESVARAANPFHFTCCFVHAALRDQVAARICDFAVGLATNSV